MSENDMADWEKRLENMEDCDIPDLENPEPSPLPCNNCGRFKTGKECGNCGRLSW